MEPVPQGPSSPPGALDEETKQLIAVGVAPVTQCPYCITGHTKLAGRKGASEEEIMEAIWVTAEIRASGRLRSLRHRAERYAHTPS